MTAKRLAAGSGWQVADCCCSSGPGDRPFEERHEAACVAAMSPYHFLRTFQALVGETPYQFLLGVRLRQAAVRLRRSDAPVSEIAFEVGFGDLSTFNRRFRRVMGASPSTYRTRYRNARGGGGQ